MGERVAATGEATKGDVVRLIDESWARLLDVLAGVPRERLVEPGVCGSWSIKDLTGHIAFWDRQAAAEAERRAAGAPPRQIDVQVMNERDAAAMADRPFEDLWSDLQDTHVQVVAFLRSLPALDPDWVKVDLWEHYDEHAADIRSWRERVGV